MPSSTAQALAWVADGHRRVTLLAEDRFRYYIKGDIGVAGSAGAFLISLPASSQREVDEIVTRAIHGGGQDKVGVGDSAGFRLSHST